MAADSGSIAYNLKVTSSPTGALISYHRRGDPPHTYAERTNATISSLPYAMLYVRIEKEGYRAEEREYDPYHDPTHEIDFQLQR